MPAHRNRVLGARPRYCGAFALSLLTSACFVSFNDYPVGAGPSAGASGSAGRGGSSSAGGANLGGGGGSAGTMLTGGTGGSAGSDTIDDPDAWIDDFEDGDASILERGGRSGSWYASNDGSGFQEPDEGPVTPEALPEPRDSSLRGIHTRGDNFTQWGALIRTDFNVGGDGEPQAYDASAYSGIKFWARSGDGEPHDFRAMVASTATDVACMPCGDHFGEDFELGPEWQEYTLEFVMLEQIGWSDGAGPSIDASELRGFQLYFSRAESFDLWLDDLRFY